VRKKKQRTIRRQSPAAGKALPSRPDSGAVADGLRQEGTTLAPPAVKPAAPGNGSHEPHALLHNLQLHQAELEMQNEELRRAQAELAQAHDRFQDLYDFAPVGYLTFDAQGAILEVNLTAAKMLGVPRQKLLGRKLPHFIARDSQDTFHLHRQQVFSEGARGECELALRGAEGAGLVIQMQSVASVDPRTQVQQCRAALIDMAKRKRAEESLKQMAAQLEERVARRTVELTRANERLRAEMAEHKRLEREILEIREREQQRIGRDLHDGLGQHLHGVSYFCTLLQAKLREKSLAEAAEAGRIVQLLSDAVKLSHDVAAGLQPVPPGPKGLASAVRQLAGRIRSVYSVDCRFHGPGEFLPADHTAATHLYRVVQEAVHNAVKHGRPTRIRVSLLPRRGQIILRVADNGAGLPRSRRRGKGLGLQIMQSRAEALGGSLAVQRARGGGTEVVLTMPGTMDHPPVL
jgi:PAS domain S-box-containing protein